MLDGNEGERGNTYGGGKQHDGSSRTMFGGPIERTAKLCTLLDDPRILGFLEGVPGKDFNYCSGDGNYYSGDTGCLRVLPGSQHPDHYVRKLSINMNQSEELFGVAPRDFPGAVALETNSRRV